MQVLKPKVSHILSAAGLAAGLAMLAPADAAFAQQQPSASPGSRNDAARWRDGRNEARE